MGLCLSIREGVVRATKAAAQAAGFVACTKAGNAAQNVDAHLGTGSRFQHETAAMACMADSNASGGMSMCARV